MHISIVLCEQHGLFQRIIDGQHRRELASMRGKMPVPTERRDDRLEGCGIRIISRRKGFCLANVRIDDGHMNASNIEVPANELDVPLFLVFLKRVLSDVHLIGDTDPRTIGAENRLKEVV